MQKEIAELIVEEDTELELINDYSGRHMYGATTHAIIARSISEFMENLVHAAAKNPETFLNANPGFRTDQMGMDVVIY